MIGKLHIIGTKSEDGKRYLIELDGEQQVYLHYAPFRYLAMLALYRLINGPEAYLNLRPFSPPIGAGAISNAIRTMRLERRRLFGLGRDCQPTPLQQKVLDGIGLLVNNKPNVGYRISPDVAVEVDYRVMGKWHAGELSEWVEKAENLKLRHSNATQGELLDNNPEPAVTKPRSISTPGRNIAEPWIGVDLDGTLAEYHGWRGPEHIGAPIPAMMKLVKALHRSGEKIKIFTSRAMYPNQVPYVREWLHNHGLPAFEVTCLKDEGLVVLYDDRCVPIKTNKGSFGFSVDAVFCDVGEE